MAEHADDSSDENESSDEIVEESDEDTFKLEDD